MVSTIIYHIEYKKNDAITHRYNAIPYLLSFSALLQFIYNLSKSHFDEKAAKIQPLRCIKVGFSIFTLM